MIITCYILSKSKFVDYNIVGGYDIIQTRCFHFVFAFAMSSNKFPYDIRPIEESEQQILSKYFHGEYFSLYTSIQSFYVFFLFLDKNIFSSLLRQRKW